MTDYLLELFSEEIPARMQARAARDLRDMIVAGLADAGLTHGRVEEFVTPRRLVLHIEGLAERTPDLREERRGPRVDAPAKAIEGFLRGAGVAREACEERETPKGSFLFAVIEKTGEAAADVIARVVADTVHNFPWPKSQRWGSGELRWVRPLRRIVSLLGSEVLPLAIDGVPVGDETSGHRFHAPQSFAVSSFRDYRSKLLAANVQIDQARRQELIADSARTLASAAGLEWVVDEGLLAEVAGLVEWPVPMIASFNPDYLEVPEEVLILTMKQDQKYFVLRDPVSGKLAPRFIFVAGLEPADGGAVVTSGNERVVGARLADARFFYEQDLKEKLEDRLPQLEDIIFHVELGSVGARARRMVALAGFLADKIKDCDRADAEEAARLAKADLVSHMVYEFPEVQGVMGRYYARAEGKPVAVANAIGEHYSPLGPSDTCPSAPLSVAVALAEKIDTLVGFFGINQPPTGSKDPYALRRAALGLIRLITENGVRIGLRALIDAAKASYEVPLVDMHDALVEFIQDRMKVVFREHGIRHDLIDAVFATGDDDLVRIVARARALQAFVDGEDGANLLAGYKRARNILRAEEKKGALPDDLRVNGAAACEDAEKTLLNGLSNLRSTVADALDAEDFEGAMGALAKLRAPIDSFFDHVTVNAEDADLRRNRLALLAEFWGFTKPIADFDCVEG